MKHAYRHPTPSDRRRAKAAREGSKSKSGGSVSSSSKVSPPGKPGGTNSSGRTVTFGGVTYGPKR